MPKTRTESGSGGILSSFEDKITAFVEALAEHEEFVPYIEKWLEEDEE